MLPTHQNEITLQPPPDSKDLRHQMDQIEHWPKKETKKHYDSNLPPCLNLRRILKKSMCFSPPLKRSLPIQHRKLRLQERILLLSDQRQRREASWASLTLSRSSQTLWQREGIQDYSGWCILCADRVWFLDRGVGFGGWEVYDGVSKDQQGNWQGHPKDQTALRVFYIFSSERVIEIDTVILYRVLVNTAVEVERIAIHWALLLFRLVRSDRRG